jgi:hypothetical protein
MIWKIWNKSKLKCEMIWKIWKKSKLKSDKIWTIWKKGKLNKKLESLVQMAKWWPKHFMKKRHQISIYKQFSD